MSNMWEKMQKQGWLQIPRKKPQLTIVIPIKEGQDAKTTLDSLKEQTFQDFKVVEVKDQNKGSNWARNEGFKKVKTPYVLFSDNDIEWEKDALETLLNTLKDSEASYSYGSYEMSGDEYCNREFDEEELRKANYISTMSLIRTEDFPGFDDEIKRFQDWDLWLNMLSKGLKGVYCGKRIFKTKPSLITRGDPQEAYEIIKKKWKL